MNSKAFGLVDCGDFESMREPSSCLVIPFVYSSRTLAGMCAELMSGLIKDRLLGALASFIHEDLHAIGL
jgi:hypothetical protein